MAKIAERLKMLRYMHNMSRYDFAMKTGISQNLIRNWEDLVAEPPVTKLIIIADLFQVTLDWICGRDKK